jgi:hypothetical protein
MPTTMPHVKAAEAGGGSARKGGKRAVSHIAVL